MKKLFGILSSVLALSVVLASCGGGGDSQSTTPPAGETTPPPAVETPAVNPETPAPGEPTTEPGTSEPGTATEGKIDCPIIVTTCGQSPGSVMINMVAVQNGFTSTNDNTLASDAFEAGDAKTLIVTTGTSMKGMGAAGTDVDTEIERCEALIQTAKDAGLTIVGAHVEGMARRADNSDVKSIEAIMALADVILVTEDSNSDDYFTTYANDNGKSLIVVKDALEISTILQ